MNLKVDILLKKSNICCARICTGFAQCPGVSRNKTKISHWDFFLALLLLSIGVCLFLNLFQSVREKPYPDEERVKGDPARDLAIVHHLCETSLGDLQSFARSVVRNLFLYTLIKSLPLSN